MRAHSINKEFQTISLHFGFSKRLIWLSIRIVQIDNAYSEKIGLFWKNGPIVLLDVFEICVVISGYLTTQSDESSPKTEI